MEGSGSGSGWVLSSAANLVVLDTSGTHPDGTTAARPEAASQAFWKAWRVLIRPN